MTMEGIPRGQLYTAVAAIVSPEDNRKDMEEATRIAVEESTELLITLIDANLAKPKERIRTFQQVTLDPDREYLLDENFIDLRFVGGIPLVADVLYNRDMEQHQQQMMEQAQQAQMMKGEPPPLSPPPFAPYHFWPLLMQVRPKVIKHIISLYRASMREEERKMMELTGEPGTEPGFPTPT